VCPLFSGWAHNSSASPSIGVEPIENNWRGAREYRARRNGVNLGGVDKYHIGGEKTNIGHDREDDNKGGGTK